MEGPLEPPLHRKVEEDEISKQVKFLSGKTIMIARPGH